MVLFSSSPSAQSAVPSHSWVVETHVPSLQANWSGAQVTAKQTSRNTKSYSFKQISLKSFRMGLLRAYMTLPHIGNTLIVFYYCLYLYLDRQLHQFQRGSLCFHHTLCLQEHTGPPGTETLLVHRHTYKKYSKIMHHTVWSIIQTESCMILNTHSPSPTHPLSSLKSPQSSCPSQRWK